MHNVTYLYKNSKYNDSKSSNTKTALPLEA